MDLIFKLLGIVLEHSPEIADIVRAGLATGAGSPETRRRVEDILPEKSASAAALEEIERKTSGGG